MPATPIKCDLQHSAPDTLVTWGTLTLAQIRPKRKSPSRHRFGKGNAAEAPRKYATRRLRPCCTVRVHDALHSATGIAAQAGGGRRSATKREDMNL